MSGLLSPDTGYFRLFSLFSSWRASARLHLKKKKFLENFSVAGASSFHGADFCHNDKEAAVNTQRIYKAFAKVRAKISPLKPKRARVASAYNHLSLSDSVLGALSRRAVGVWVFSDFSPRREHEQKRREKIKTGIAA